jgi:hypothetical protein
MWIERNLRAAIAAVGTALRAGCGSDSPVTPSSPAPPPPAPVVVAQGSGPLAPFTLAFVPFGTTQIGRLEISVDWTFARNDVDAYLTLASCTPQQFLALQCNLIAFSESTTAKPERLTLPNAAVGAYRLWILNLGTQEGVAYQVVLHPSASASSASPSAAAAAGAPSRIGLARHVTPMS